MTSNMSRKKMLIIHHGTGLGGGLVALVALINILLEDYDIEVFCVHNSDAVEYLERSGLKVHIAKSKFYEKYYQLNIYSEASFSGILSLIRSTISFISYFISIFYYNDIELKKFSGKFDILYLNSLFLSDWMPAGKKYFKEIFIHVREPLKKGAFGFRRNIIRNVIKKYYSKIIYISKDNRDRVQIIKNSIVFYDPILPRYNDKVIIDTEKKYKYFCFVGGSQRIKGYDQVLKALKYLDSNIKVFFIGSMYEIEENIGSLQFRFRALFSKFLRETLPSLKEIIASSQNLIIVGKVENVFDYYENSIATICPFAKPHACLPILESLSVGKPVIISDVEGMDEFVNDSCSLIFKNGNYIDLAKKINDLSRNMNKNYFDDCLAHYKQLQLENSDISKFLNSNEKI